MSSILFWSDFLHVCCLIFIVINAFRTTILIINGFIKLPIKFNIFIFFRVIYLKLNSKFESSLKFRSDEQFWKQYLACLWPSKSRWRFRSPERAIRSESYVYHVQNVDWFWYFLPKMTYTFQYLSHAIHNFRQFGFLVI